jgi:putative endonuclease
VNSRQQLGKLAEEHAAIMILEAGAIIVERNWRGRRGELDIIYLHDGDLCFGEVRCRPSMQWARESISPRKQQQVRRVAEEYLVRKKMMQSRIRFDAIAVAIENRRLKEIDWIKAAF